jgi:hypothetical protein
MPRLHLRFAVRCWRNCLLSFLIEGGARVFGERPRAAARAAALVSSNR